MCVHQLLNLPKDSVDNDNACGVTSRSKVWGKVLEGSTVILGDLHTILTQHSPS